MARGAASGVEVAAAALAALCLLCLATAPGRAAPTPDRTLWPSPNEGLEQVVAEQATDASVKWSNLNSGFPDGIGQTFLWPGGDVVRIDFLVKNNANHLPGVVSLYRLNNPPDIVDRELVFSDEVVLTGRVEWQHRTVFPSQGAQQAGTYLLLFTGPARQDAYYVAGSPLSEDPYPDGTLLRKGFLSTGDLWFKVWTDDPGGTPTPPPVDVFPAVPTPLPVPAPAPEVSRQAYADRVAGYMATRRPLATSGAPPTRNSYAWAVGDALLYQVPGADCDGTSCALTAAEMLRNAHDYREQICGEIDEGVIDYADPSCLSNIGFTWLLPPTLAYWWIRDDPAIPAADLQAAQTVLLDTARRQWTETQELGAHNRTSEAMAAFGLMAHLFPGDPQASEWSTYAECLWSYFSHYDDTDESSGQYNALFWRGLLVYAEVSGRTDPVHPEYVWGDPDFLALVDRMAGHHTALGPFPNYGDSGGFGHSWPDRLVLLEAAATAAGAATGKSRYKRLADRLWDYHTGRICDVASGGEHLFGDLESLSLAWLAADESILPDAGEPYGEAPLVDHTLEGDELLLAPGATVGQTFQPDTSPLVRIDLKLRNLGRDEPGRLRLWRWLGDHASTVASAPLYEAAVELSGLDVATVRTFRPYLTVEAGAPYYVELERAAAPLAAVLPPTGSYGGGELWVGGSADPARDLWLYLATLDGLGSSISTRVKTVILPRGEWDDNPFPASPECGGYQRTEAMQPPIVQLGQDEPILVNEKLVLRSGLGVDDLMAVFELLPTGYQHGQPSMGALSLLTDAGSVVLRDGPEPYGSYTSSGTPQPFDESLPYVRRHTGGMLGSAGDAVSVDHFADYRNASVAHLSWSDPEGWGIAQERRIYFAKNRLLWVRDRMTFPAAMTVSAGPVWHVADAAPLPPGAPGNWFDAYTHRLMHNVWHVANSHRFARFFFVPRAGYEIAAYRDPQYGPTDGAACDFSPDICGNAGASCRAGHERVLYQRFTGAVAAGQTRWFDTVIVPNDLELDEDAIRVIHDGGASAILEVDVLGETLTLVDNPNGDSLDTGPVTTDATYLLSSREGGEPSQLIVEGATHLRVAEVDESFPVPTSLETDARFLAGGDQCTNAALSGIPDSDGDGLPDSCEATALPALTTHALPILALALWLSGVGVVLGRRLSG